MHGLYHLGKTRDLHSLVLAGVVSGYIQSAMGLVVAWQWVWPRLWSGDPAWLGLVSRPSLLVLVCRVGFLG
jgi:hypothetical protein